MLDITLAAWLLIKFQQFYLLWKSESHPKMIIQNSVNHTTHQTRGKQLLSNSSVLNTDISYTPNIRIPTVIEFTTNKRKKTIKPLTTQPLAKNKTVMFKYHDGNSWYSAKLISRGRFLLVNMQMHATFTYKMMMSIKGIGFDRDV